MAGQAGLVKTAIVILLFILLALALMWKLINHHTSCAKKRRLDLSRDLRRKLLEHTKDAPRIALIMIQDEQEATGKRKNVNMVTASCLWSNAVATPYLSHRIIPVVCKLQSKDATYGIPSYSFCKHGQHDSCALNASLAEICKATRTMQMLVKTTCVHCPRVPSGYSFGDVCKSYLYAIKHLQDTGVAYDYVCIIPSSTCLSYGWDETLIQQIQLAKQSYKKHAISSNIVLSSPVESIYEAMDHVEKEANAEAALLQAQANQSHTSLSIPAKSIIDRLDLSVAQNKPGEWDGGSVLHAISASVGAPPDVLESLVWQLPRKGLYASTKESNGQATFYMRRFELTSTGQDETPSLTPWWCCNNLSFLTSADMLQLLQSFESLLVANVCFSDAEWSMALLQKRWLCASILKSVAVDVHPRRSNPLKLDIQQKSFIDWSQVAQMAGIVLVGTHLQVSPDASLGLLALDGSWYKQDFAHNNNQVKEHDILARFGAWSRYFALRG